MGAVHDQSIRSLSDHLRMALDGSFPGKLQKFVALLDSVGRPSQFEHLLKARLPVFVQGGDAWQRECSKAIQQLIQLDRAPIPDLDGQVKITWPDVRPAVDQYPVKEWRELQPLAEKSPEDDVDAIGISESTDQNPSQRIRLSQSVALQGLEDRQYLAWSWNRLRGDEQQVLDTQLAVLLGGTDRTLKLMAALTRIALLTRNSLHTVLSIPLRTTVEEDWGCDVHGGSMHRCTPRRAVRWRSDPSCTPWISQLQPDWLIRLPDAIASPLREAFGRVRSATHLHDLWDVIDSPPARVFNEWCVATKGLERVSSGLLPAVAEQSVFNHSFDPVFSRLMTAPARAGISGAGAYPSWSMGAVGQAMQAIGTDWALKIGEPSVNGLGSELDPLDASISAAFDIARKRLESLDLQSNWIATHNRITGYTLAMLLAATGARPVNSMFESVTHFDFDNGRIYIEDKANSRGIAGPSGRVLPLPSQVSVWMQGCYLPHLQATAEYVSTAIPELGLEMCRQAQGHGSDKLPLFVFLRDIQGFDWQEVSEGALSALQLFDWPLPWNLFRHRMATRSRLLGMDPELVDAQLGHAEGGSETYGDWSPRCWADDESSWRSHIQRVFDLLAINPPRLPKITYIPVEVASDYKPFVSGRKFGILARKVARSEQHKAARQTARRDIADYLSVRKKEPYLLSADEWDELGRNMLFRNGNLPHSNATLRYEEYEKLATDAWRTHGVRVKIKNIVRLLPPGRSGFDLKSLHAVRTLTRLNDAVQAQFERLVYSKVSKTDAAWLAAMDLALNGRVANTDALSAVLNAWSGQRVEILQFGPHAYIDIGAPADQVGGRSPVQRYLLPFRSVRLIQRAQSLDRMPTLVPTPEWVKAMVNECETNVALESTHILAWVCEWVDAANRIELPGLVAGMLGGRVQTYAFWAEDWSRAAYDAPRIHPLHAHQIEKEQATLSHLRHASPQIGNDPEDISALNRKLLGNIRQVLQSAKDPKDSRKAAGSLSDGRRKILGTVNQILNRAPAGVSPAVFALGEWIAHLLERPRHGNGVLTYSSINRYLGALSSGFLDFGENIDFRDLDSDDLEDFFLQVIDPGLDVDVPPASDLTPLSPEQEETERSWELPQATKQNQRYVLLRLKEFHNFSAKRYGLSPIDWSQVDQGLTGVLGHPGVLTWKEYCTAFHCLCPNAENAPLDALQDACILLLCYRFGLRGGEAISLARSDWVEPVGNAMVLLVRGRHKRLKTRASLRQVPLVHPLEPFERAVMSEWFTHWFAVSQGDKRVPLFCSAEDIHRVADMAPIRKRINAVLKQVSGSESTTLHHARHAFANLLAGALLEGFDASISNALPPPDWNSVQVRKLLLGVESTTRRAPWAIARMMGHSRLTTTFGSYVHILHGWTASRLCNLSPTADRFRLPAKLKQEFSSVDEWEMPILSTDPISRSTEPGIGKKTTPNAKMLYLHLRSKQVSPKVAGRELRMESDVIQRLEAEICVIAKKLLPELSKLDERLLPGIFLSKINEAQWTRLLEKSLTIQSLPENITWIDHISANRQLLLWKPGHFEKFDGILSCLDLKWSDFDVYSSRQLGENLQEHINRRKILIRSQFTQQKENGKNRKRFQIDTAQEIDPEGIAMHYKQRIALMPSGVTCLSSYDLIILLLSASD
jgi:integrase